jgi:hypothetical protein
MKPSLFLSLALFAGFACPAHAQAPTPAATAVTVTVQPGARQTFRGFGVSEFNYGSPGAGTFDRLTPARRALLWRLLYHDLRLKTLRLWYDPATASPAPGKLDVSGFVKSYLTSGLIADARKNGITTLLLGPDHVPPYMLQNPADHSSRIKNDQIGPTPRCWPKSSSRSTRAGRGLMPRASPTSRRGSTLGRWSRRSKTCARNWTGGDCKR